MVYFHDYPDVTIHTQKDQPENLDPTKLGRVVYMGAGIAWTLAALPQEEAPKLLDYTRAWAEERVAQKKMTAPEGRDRELALREATAQGSATLASLARLWPLSLLPMRSAGADELALGLSVSGDLRVPVRNPAIQGPLNVYYFDYLSESGVDVSAAKLSKRDGGEVLAYESFNLVDSQRTVSEIHDILAGRYFPAPLTEFSEYMDLLAKAKAIMWK
jgi:aminopeptidase YwaD